MNLRPSGYEPDELPTAPPRDIKLVLKTGIEPVRYRYRRILSPVRLPISPLQHIYLEMVAEIGLEPTTLRV